MKIQAASESLLYIRLRFGMVEFHCPICGKWGLAHVGYKTGYLIRCKGHHRGNIFVLGHTLRPFRTRGRRPPWPPDMVFPPDREMHVKPWQPGEPVNQILGVANELKEGDDLDERGRR